MKVLAVTAQKGGVGKSRISVNLAVAALQDGLTAVVIDTDRQATACFWNNLRNAVDGLEEIAVISTQATQIKNILGAIEAEGVDLVIIDTPPFSELDTSEALKASDYAIFPTKSELDSIESNNTTAQLATFTKTPYHFFFNQVPPQGREAELAEQILSSTYNQPLCTSHLVSRAAYKHAFNSGQGVLEFEPDGKAAEELTALWGFIKTQLGMVENRLSNKEEMALS